MSGGFDPITPSSYAKSVARQWTGSTLLEIPGWGHGVLSHPCAENVYLQFLENPERALDLSCRPEEREWSVLLDYTLNHGSYRLGMEVLQLGSPALAAGWGVASLLALSALVIPFRRRRASTPWLGLTIGLSAVIGLVFFASHLWLVINTAFLHPEVLTFGIMGNHGWLTFLGWVLVVLAAASAVMLFLFRKSLYWPTRLAGLGAVGLAVFSLVTGLIQLPL
jgi:hypothetical protein